ncbi:LAGLIDADG family homing endonuclease [Tengunoibacter tsumagoiensis]|uniref:Ribonucleoside-diphosphate reductase n=1 Tax=Tengunoibacter tsumagoiensis TaxID=2014871 RepID=A0A401ZYW4_9CHLR|nr:LAGLIDADG family homing endonuclease [Tengunoibacter tsumagoiensis]GCE12039.1 hypothetical protein KTT_18980 [Tengunoibacter tsumagoiensis]
MLEQIERLSSDDDNDNPQTMTQLEGIRQKVFMDRYSLKDPDGNPLEFYPEQLWKRVARGIAAVEQTEEKRAEWEKLFYEALNNFQFVPGGRILAGAGTGHQVTYYNCFVIPSPEDSRQGILDNLKVMTEIMARGGGVGINLSTLRPRGSYIKTVNGTASGPCSWAQLYSVATGDVIQQGGCFGPNERISTSKGLIPASELADRLDAGESFEALTHKGWRAFNYVFRNGTKDLYEVTTSRGYRVRVTLDHKMGVLRNGEITTIALRDLAEGDEILLLLGEYDADAPADSEPVQLSTTPYERSLLSTTLDEQVTVPTQLTAELAYLLGFSYGDGHVMGDRGLSLSVANNQPEVQERLVASIRSLFGIEPAVSAGDDTNNTNIQLDSRVVVEWLHENGLLTQKAETIRVPEAIFRSPADVVEAFIAGFFATDGYDRRANSGYGIDSISRELLGDIQLLLLNQGVVSHITVQHRAAQGWQPIYRLIVTGAHFKKRFSAFVQSFEDQGYSGLRSHQSFFKGTKDRVSPYALTRVRERVAAAGGVAMVERLDALLGVLPDPIVSIEPLGPSEVFDFEVDDVHLLAGNGLYTSNSRRGALMLMLDDTHPDVEEFITVKRTAGKIQHANLSVCISDAFMQAVKDDADWNLTWQGEVKKTIRARSLWDLICTSAWESAEPGMVFMDRYNKESNTWYYENIRCVNPCVTGDTLVYTDQGMIPASELAEMGAPVTVVSPDSENVALRQASHVFSTGVKPVFRLQTEEGYTIRLTEDHKVLTTGGWKEAGTLNTGDKIKLLHAEGYFGTTGNADLGRVLGWLVGDGSINTRRAGSVMLSFFGKEQAIAPQFAEAVNRLVAAPEGQRQYVVGAQKVADRDETRVESVRLLRLIDPELLSNKLQVPPSVFRGSHEMQKGFLSALFTADGSVQGNLEKGASIRLTSVNQQLLEGVQQLLLNFGIYSRIYTELREAGSRELPDGKGGSASYECQSYHDLVITKGSFSAFAHQISFLTQEKQSKLEDLVAAYKRGPYKEDFTATFVSLTAEGEEMVYDLTEPEAHLFVANGLVVHNCGEQGLPPWGVCNLGALNLSAFVSHGEMDWEKLAQISKIAMRFLDNVVDANEYFIAENREAQLSTRRTGLGTMGLADALIKMKVAYGSDASLPIIERIYATIRDASYEASADNAAEKGSFPMFDREKYLQGKFIQRLPQPIQEKIANQGIRNAVLLTQAPTGTTSLLSGASSGIEPVYDFAMIRRDRTGEHILYHHLLQEWRDEHPNEATPDYFVASKDLTPEEHVRVQSMIQRYTDSSISKTVNAPNEHTVEDVQNLYRLAYEMGCKGVTYYRDGSRDAVLTRVEDEKKAAEKAEKAAQAQAPMFEPVTSIHQGIKQRPSVVQGYTRQVRAPEGKINITINSDDQGPFEVFVNVGKAGSDIAALSEALGRLISLNLQLLSPLSQTDRAQEITNQLRGIGGSRSVGFGVQQVRSLPDAVARALEIHMEALNEAPETVAPAPAPVSKVTEEPVAESHVSAPVNLNQLRVTGNLCPQCGCNTMVYEEGCKKCYSCGHSEC